MNNHVKKYAVCANCHELFDVSAELGNDTTYYREFDELGTYTLKSGNIIVSSVKMPEICKKYDSCKKEMYDTECTGGYYLITDNSSSDKKKIILRVYETEGTKTRASIRFKNAVSNAWFVDINEKPIDCGKGSNSCENEKYKTNESSYIKAEGSILSFDVDACSIATICVEFAEI